MNPKRPADLVRETSRLTKADYYERKAAELPVLDNAVVVPDTLADEALRAKFVFLAGKLDDLGVWSVLDNDELARYVVADAVYHAMSAALMEAIEKGDLDAVERLQSKQDKAFRQAHASADSLCLNITSRCRVSRPAKDEHDEKEIRM